MIIVRGPSALNTKYGWLCILLEWTNRTRHDLITRNLLPKPEITTNQKLNTMPMYDKPWGTELNSWKSHGTAAKSKIWAESSTKLLRDQYLLQQLWTVPPSRLERLCPMVAQIRRQLSLWFLRLRPTGVDYDLGGRFFGRLCIRHSMVCSLGSERISHALCCS
jgi:hypothetical protein